MTAAQDGITEGEARRILAHTPGPWHWAKLGRTEALCAGDANETYILRVNAGSMGYISFQQADRDLIAAAPDLLEACEAAQDDLVALTVLVSFRECRNEADVERAAIRVREVTAMLEGAIAKARGEHQ